MNGKPPRTRYMFRYCLQPWNYEVRLQELLEYCRRNDIDSVMLFTQSHDLHERMPTFEEAREFLPILEKAIRSLQARGIEAGLNVWFTLGHGDCGGRAADVLPFQTQVGHDGSQCQECLCPLDPIVRKYLAEIYSLWASTKPDYIFVDDDFRLHNHNPVRWGCFCPIHVRAISDRIGREISRQELVERILASGYPPAREKVEWMRLLGDTMVETASIIEKALHAVSPKTQIGLMVSNPAHHTVEGRRWKDLLRALSGSHKPLIRPALATPRGSSLISAGEWFYTLVPAVIHMAGSNVRSAPELENSPFTSYANSASCTRLLIAYSLMTGFGEITLDLYDFVGGPLLDYEPEIEEMLRESRPFFDAIVRLTYGKGTLRGVQVPIREDEALFRVGPFSSYDDLFTERAMEKSLPLLGFSLTYENERVRAISGDLPYAYTNEELKEFLSGGLFLDASAARAFTHRGLQRYTGVAVANDPARNMFLAAERVLDSEFGGEVGQLMAIRHIGAGISWRLVPLPGARVVSEILWGALRHFGPGLVLYENSLGGRVAVTALDGQSGSISQTCFRNYVRHQQLVSALKWANRGALPLVVHGVPNSLPIRRDVGSRVVIGVVNLSTGPTGPWEVEVGDVPETLGKVETLESDGNLTRLDEHCVRREKNAWTIKVNRGIASMDLALLTIS